jgi:hypothetical protein
MAIGVLIAKKAPPPGKLKGYGGGDPAEPDADDEEGDDKAARVGQMQDVIDAFKRGDAEAACEALDGYLGR